MDERKYGKTKAEERIYEKPKAEPFEPTIDRSAWGKDYYT